MEITPHARILELLFAHKGKTSPIFKDVLGLQEIHHIAVTCIHNNQLNTFSSTPAMEFNLFKDNLWRFDKSYAPDWFTTNTQGMWESLYVPERYDELYYLKQIQHHYPLGLSLTDRKENIYFIYSLASKKNNRETQDIFQNQYSDLLKIGQYCSHQLLPLFGACNPNLDV